jgi:carbon-monoxide dehydrogenase medium subunit
MKNFGYQKVFTMEEAFRLLEQYPDKARILAGGTDLLVKVRQNILSPELLIDIKEIPGLDEIRYNTTAGLQIGALTSIRKLETSPVIKENFGIITEAAASLASFQVRTRATLGGNLCKLSPHGDMAPCLMSLGARVKIAGKKEDRLVPLENFFVGPGKTELRSNEILAAVQVPIPLPFTACIYIKHSIRKSMDLAVVSVAVALSTDSKKVKCQEVKIVLGAVDFIPLRAKRAESGLRGQKLDEFSISEASRIASEEIRPISDIRGSGEYRKEILRVITERALKHAQGPLL